MQLENKIIFPLSKNTKFQSINQMEIEEESSNEISNNSYSKPCLTIAPTSEERRQGYEREVPKFLKFKVVIQKFDEELYKLNKFAVKPKNYNSETKIVSTFDTNDNGIKVAATVKDQICASQMKDQAQQKYPTTLQTFMWARYKNEQGNEIDLSYSTFNQVAKYSFEENIMNNKTYNRFLLNTYPNIQKIFVKQFDNPNKMVLNFKLQLFSLIDHRLFSQILCSINPKKYHRSLPYPVMCDKQITRFYKRIYSMSETEYIKVLHQFNLKNQRFWMPKPEDNVREFKFDVIVCDQFDFSKTSKNGRLMRERKNINLMEDSYQN